MKMRNDEKLLVETNSAPKEGVLKQLGRDELAQVEGGDLGLAGSREPRGHALPRKETEGKKGEVGKGRVGGMRLPRLTPNLPRR